VRRLLDCKTILKETSGSHAIVQMLKPEIIMVFVSACKLDGNEIQIGNIMFSGLRISMVPQSTT
jgi:hypothetical protein